MIESISYGIINGVLVALLAVALTMHYKISRYFDFFLPSLVLLGGYLFYVCSYELKIPFVLAVINSGLLCLLSALLIDLLVLTPLHRIAASRAILLLSSLGGYIIIISALGMAFGSATKVARLGLEETSNLLGIQIPIIRLWLLTYAVAILIALALLIRGTRLGRLLYAAFDSSDLLEACGYDRDSLRRITYSLAGFLAGVCGALLATDLGVEPTGAMPIFLIAATAVIVGGAGRLASAVYACLALTILRALLIWIFPAQWSETVIYAILFCFLCLRPQGIFPLRHLEYFS